MAVRTVVVRYAADMNDLLRGLDAGVKKNKQLGDEAEKAGKRIDTMAKVGAGVGLAMGFAIGKFAEFDAQMSAVAANTGATADELSNLREAALEAGAATQFSATEAAQGINELAKAGVSTADILGGGLTGSLSLAAAGQIEVKDAAEIAATALTQFKLRGQEVGHVADLLAAGANNAQGGVADLGMALKQSGLVASQVGLSIEETTAGLTAFASAGLIGSDAGTSFKTMLQRLTPTSDEAAGLMQELGISAYDAGGNFIGLEKFAGNLKDSLKDLTPEQRNAAMATIFGSDAVRAANVLYEQGAEGIRKWTSEVNQQGFAARNAAKLTDNFKGDLERLQGSLETAFIKTGSGANDVLRQMTQGLEGLVDIVAQLPGPVLIGAGAFTALALAGPKIGQLAKVVTGPLTSGMARFREEMALQKALAAGVGATYDGLGERVEKAADKTERSAGRIAAARNAIGGMKGAASGLLSVLGGPWGVALGAATVAVTAFATAQANAQQAGEEFADTLDEQTGALTEASRAFVAKKLTADISPEDLKALQSIGVNLAQAGQAALDGGDKMAAYRTQLQRVMEQHPELLDQLNGLSNSVENTNEDVERGKLVWAGYQAAVSGTAQSANAAEGPLEKAATAVRGVSAESEQGKAAIEAYDDALKEITDNVAAVADASDDLAAILSDKTQAMQDAAKKQAEATKDPKDSWEDYAETVKLSAKDIVDTLNEQTKAAEKFRDNLLVVQKTGDIEFLKWISEQPPAVAEAYATGTAKEQKKIHDAFKKNVGAQQALGIAQGLEDETTTVTDAAGRVYKATKDKLTGQTILIPTGVIAPPAAQLRSVASTILRAIGTIHIPTVPDIVTPTGATIRVTGVSPTNRAEGGISRAYAAGGIDAPNAHVAEIASVTTGERRWNEPETKGEAYIPLANDWRRPRAKGIASETVRRLGGNVTWHATGSISGGFSGMNGINLDYDKMAAAFAKMQMPNLTIVSGEDARVAAQHGVREFIYARDNG